VATSPGTGLSHGAERGLLATSGVSPASPTMLYQHALPIVLTEGGGVGQFVVCLSFLRRCMHSAEGVSCDLFLHAVDEYAASGLEVHSCSVPLACVARDDCLERAAKRYAAGAAIDPLRAIKAEQLEIPGVEEESPGARLVRAEALRKRLSSASVASRREPTWRGALILAAVFLGLARIGELVWSDAAGEEHHAHGPGVPLYLIAPPLEDATRKKPLTI
jgi:hypothetical protein